jgi:two-component system sensor histidine kinase UhpB
VTDPIREIAEQVARITDENARLLQSLAETERRFQRISRGVLRLQEEERGRISRDLHDGVGQLLTALKIQLELLEQDVARARPELSARTAAARELADACLAEVRQLSHLIRPQMLDELGLMPTLRWLARTVQKRAGIVVDFVHDGSEQRLDPALETLVFRLVQEALTNVAKHAGADQVAVRVSQGQREIKVTVEDAGAGFAAEEILNGLDEDRGFGVRAMRDRVKFFNGRFELISAPGRGTRIDVAVPLSPEGRS